MRFSRHRFAGLGLLFLVRPCNRARKAGAGRMPNTAPFIEAAGALAP